MTNAFPNIILHHDLCSNLFSTFRLQAQLIKHTGGNAAPQYFVLRDASPWY